MVGCQFKIPRKTQYLNYNLATQIFFLFVKVAIYGTVLGFGQSRAGAVLNEEKVEPEPYVMKEKVEPEPYVMKEKVEPEPYVMKKKVDFLFDRYRYRYRLIDSLFGYSQSVN